MCLFNYVMQVYMALDIFKYSINYLQYLSRKVFGFALRNHNTYREVKFETFLNWV